jgi:hypothetical protein
MIADGTACEQRVVGHSTLIDHAIPVLHRAAQVIYRPRLPIRWLRRSDRRASGACTAAPCC